MRSPKSCVRVAPDFEQVDSPVGLFAFLARLNLKNTLPAADDGFALHTPCDRLHQQKNRDKRYRAGEPVRHATATAVSPPPSRAFGRLRRRPTAALDRGDL
jgi:hypothetical protein